MSATVTFLLPLCFPIIQKSVRTSTTAARLRGRKAHRRRSRGRREGWVWWGSERREGVSERDPLGLLGTPQGVVPPGTASGNRIKEAPDGSIRFRSETRNHPSALRRMSSRSLKFQNDVCDRKRFILKPQIVVTLYIPIGTFCHKSTIFDLVMNCLISH